jgi:mono/diheme cytochrome c family protein
VSVVRIAVSCFLVAVAWANGAGLVLRAPAKVARVSNPFEGNERALWAGAKLYARECAACHGSNREGGEKAPSLNRPAVFQSPPGALFWVLRNGSLHRGMPSFAHLPEPERWQIITLLRGVASRHTSGN